MFSHIREKRLLASACIRAAVTGWIFMKFDIGDLHENLYWEILNLFKNRAQILGILHEELSIFYCCRRHKFAINTFLCSTQFCYIPCRNVKLNNQQNALLPYRCNNATLKRQNITFYVNCPLSVYNKLNVNNASTLQPVINGFLSPRHGASSGCEWTNCLQIWRVAANIFNKQLRTADKGWSFSLGVGRGANNSSP